MPRKAQIPHLRIRIEPRLLARLEKSREKSGRTLTGEIVERLEDSFRREDRQAEMEAAAERGARSAIEFLMTVGPEGLKRIAPTVPQAARVIHELLQSGLPEHERGPLPEPKEGGEK